MTSADAVKALLDSPELPRAFEQLFAVVQPERHRRELFYDEITSDMKAGVY